MRRHWRTEPLEGEGDLRHRAGAAKILQVCLWLVRAGGAWVCMGLTEAGRTRWSGGRRIRQASAHKHVPRKAKDCAPLQSLPHDPVGLPHPWKNSTTDRPAGLAIEINRARGIEDRRSIPSRRARPLQFRNQTQPISLASMGIRDIEPASQGLRSGRPSNHRGTAPPSRRLLPLHRKQARSASARCWSPRPPSEASRPSDIAS